MGIIRVLVAPLALAMTLGAAQVLAADATGVATVEAAKTLYAEAVSLEISDPKRAELLGEAEAILLEVIEKNPQSLDAHRKLMGVYLAKQEYRKGIRTMQDAITLSPEDPKLFIALAFLYEHSGELEFSSAMLNQALALDPDQALAKEYKAAIRKKIEARKVDQAHEQEMMSAMHGKAMPGAHPPPAPEK